MGCFFFLSIIICSCTPEPTDSTNEFIKISKAFSEAFNKGDANAVAKFYTSTAKIYPQNDKVIEGQEAIEDFWRHAMNLGVKNGLFETVKAETVGNITIEEGRYKLYAKGDILVDQGKYIVTWKKVDGKWKLHNDIFNTSKPAPNIQASINDTVWIIKKYVYADKVEQFEEFHTKYLGPAGLEYDQRLSKTVRRLKPVEKNKDGTFTYTYIMDPVLSSFKYDIEEMLSAKFGEEKAKEYMEIYKACLKGQKQDWQVAVQTGW